MRALENIIQEFSGSKEGGLTHKRAFLNSKSSNNRMSWYNRRRYGA